MLVADLIVASDRATFASRYSDVGLTPDCGVSTLLPEAVGTRRALELTLTSRTLTAAEALDWGLVTEVVAPESLDARAREIAASWLAGATGGIRAGQAPRALRADPELPGGARRRGPHDRRRVRDARRAGGHRPIRVGLGQPPARRPGPAGVRFLRWSDPHGHLDAEPSLRAAARCAGRGAALRSQQTPRRPRRTRPRAVPGARRPRWRRRARAR